MPRKRKEENEQILGNVDRNFIKQYIKENGIKDWNDVEDISKKLVKIMLEEMLKAEMDYELGYEKYSRKPEDNDNYRNGYSKKTVITKNGEMELTVPRDRNGEFEPQIVKKRQRHISVIEDLVLSLYSKGLSVRDIRDHIKEIYDVEVSPEKISMITNSVMPLINDWRNRPLEEIYAIVYLDASFYSVKEDGVVKRKAIYNVIGINLDGYKDILGIYIEKTESSRFWMNVLNDLKARGVKDILIASVDGLNGFVDAIHTAFPNAEVQMCIVHQLRNTFKYVPHKHRKAVVKDLKPIYQAPSLEAAEAALEDFEKKWGETHPLAVQIWKNNWDKLSAYFKYSEPIRRLIYTTNPIENVHRQFRKITKNKSVFPTDDSLIKAIYFAAMRITEKWTTRIRDWGQILNELRIYFGDDRVPIYRTND
ncbi:transposase [Marinitoga piezophila KA3]|uniref:Mutator family transposase n=1 Tax=Marinitoga piezophila (strain DSM 14283 / JCM 11233 / KA3) TaxID=443254 RepID=H2J7C8_MARPK|nr:IS256 family transposase [Marinitoga piezophila]AEX85320.1 transposase [Marinitoga piezophila KA3]